MPEAWRKNKAAGKDWLRLFMKRCCLAVRKPKPTSLVRASGFNCDNTNRFFDNLIELYTKHKYEAHQVYNSDETGVNPVHDPQALIARKGTRQIGQITSGERGELVTIICTANAAGNSIPPMMIFPRKKFQRIFMKEAPPSYVGHVSPSSWVIKDLLVNYLEHFVKYSRCSKERRVLLIIDTHAAHTTLKGVEYARENGLDILTLLPYTSHKLQPLDVSVYGPFKQCYNNGVSDWLCQIPGIRLSISEMLRL